MANVRKEVEAAIKKEQKWVLKSHIDTDRKKSTRYTSYVHHDLSEYVVNKGTLLHLAVLHDKPDMVKYLVSKGLDVNARAEAAYRVSYRVGTNSAQKPTPLQLAVLLYRHKCMEVLLARGADASAAASGERLLSSAARVVKGTVAHVCVLWGRQHALRVLLKHEPSLASSEAAEVFRFGLPADNCYAIKDASPAHLAVLLAHIDSLEELLVYVTDTDVASRYVALASDARDKGGELRAPVEYTKKSVTPVQLGERLGRSAIVALLSDRLKLKALRAGGSRKGGPAREHADGESSENLDREGSVRHRVRAGAASSGGASSGATSDAPARRKKRVRKPRGASSSAATSGPASTAASGDASDAPSGKRKRKRRSAATAETDGTADVASDFSNSEADADLEFFRGGKAGKRAAKSTSSKPSAKRRVRKSNGDGTAATGTGTGSGTGTAATKADSSKPKKRVKRKSSSK